MVILDPTTHIYLDADNNQYQSVTRFINKFVPQFDFDNKSKQYATKYGMDVEEVRDSWRQKNKQSTDFGSMVHEHIEYRLSNKKTKQDLLLEDTVESISGEIEKCFNHGDYLLEHTLWDEKYKIAGTADLIVDSEDDFSIVDFKTNKQIKYTNDFEDKHLLKPVNHLPNSEYFKYALQLSFYAYLYKLRTSKKVNRLCFYWLKRQNNSYDNLKNSKWIRFNVPYLEEEVKTLLNHEEEN